MLFISDPFAFNHFREPFPALRDGTSPWALYKSAAIKHFY
jgi:hypothetical protein